MAFWWQPDGQGWQATDVSYITGEKVTGSLTSWTAPNGPYLVEHVAGYNDSGEVLNFWWHADGKDWRVTNVSQITKQKVAGPLASWTAQNGPYLVEHVAGYNSDGDLLDFWWQADGKDWRVDNVSQVTNQKVEKALAVRELYDPFANHSVGQNERSLNSVFAVDPTAMMVAFDKESDWEAMLFDDLMSVFSAHPFTIFYSKPAFLLYPEQNMHHVAIVMDNGNLVLRRQYLRELEPALHPPQRPCPPVPVRVAGRAPRKLV